VRRSITVRIVVEALPYFRRPRTFNMLAQRARLKHRRPKRMCSTKLHANFELQIQRLDKDFTRWQVSNDYRLAKAISLAIARRTIAVIETASFLARSCNLIIHFARKPHCRARSH